MKKARSSSSWGKAEVLCLALFCALGILFMPDQGCAWGVYSYAAAADFQRVTDSVSNDYANQGFAAAASTNTWAAAQATAFGSLGIGMMQVHAYAYNQCEYGNPYPWSENYHLSASYGAVRIEDTLFFTVPAGYYPQGVTVTSSAFLTGTINHNGDITQAEYNFTARFGGIQCNAGAVYAQGVVSEHFLLEKKIVWEGATLVESTKFLVDVMGYLHVGVTAGSGPDSRSVTADFTHSAGFLSVETPPGVTWGSESGVFLSQQIPLPGSLILLGSGLLGLAGWRRLKKG
jgi:hypothetical protein